MSLRGHDLVERCLRRMLLPRRPLAAYPFHIMGQKKRNSLLWSNPAHLYRFSEGLLYSIKIWPVFFMDDVYHFSPPALFQKIPGLMFIAARQVSLIATNHKVYKNSIQKETATETGMAESWQLSPFLAKINWKNNCFFHRNVFSLVVFLKIYSLRLVVEKVYYWGRMRSLHFCPACLWSPLSTAGMEIIRNMMIHEAEFPPQEKLESQSHHSWVRNSVCLT